MNLLEKSTHDMTPGELRECHHRMWGWLAETAMRSKRIYFFENGLSLHEKELSAFCYACVLAARESKEKHGETGPFWDTPRCLYCPCKWSEKELTYAEHRHYPCECVRESPYLAWIAAIGAYHFDISKAEKYALLVRDAWK
jgi:hypothetical protein